MYRYLLFCMIKSRDKPLHSLYHVSGIYRDDLSKNISVVRTTPLKKLYNKYILELIFIQISYAFLIGSGYFAVDGNLPLESILP